MFLHCFNSDTKVNIFHKGSANVQIAEKINENDPVPQDTTEAVLTWDEDGENYICQKEITITSQSDTQYIRVMLIPSWCDVNGNIVAGFEEYSDFHFMQFVRENGENRIDVLNSKNTLICSFILNNNFETYWDFWDKQDHTRDTTPLNVCYFYYKSKLAKNATTQPLIKSVRIPAEVYNAMYQYSESVAYYIHIDVIADSIEQYYDTDKDVRNFG